MRRYGLLFLCALTATLSFASHPWLKHPLRWVAADSVVTWGYDDRDFRALSFSACAEAAPYPFGLTRKAIKERKQLMKEWTEGARRLNRVGGLGDELREPQTLSAVTWMGRAAALFLQQGDAAYIDCMERALYNAVMASARDSVGGELGMERRVAANVLQAAPGLMYAVSTEGTLYVNLFANSMARVTVGGRTFTIDQVTDFPVDGRVRIRLTKVGEPFSFKICVRMPDWTGVRQNAFAPYIYSTPDRVVPTLYVNGHEVNALQPDEKGWIVIEKKWRSMDEIYIDLPLQPYYFRPDTETARNALLRGNLTVGRGPQVYLVDAPTEGCYFSLTSPLQIDEELDTNGNVLISGKMYREEGTPQDTQAPEVPFRAKAF